MEALKHLSALADQRDRQRYPSLPEHARTKPKYTDKTANGLTKCILDFLRFTGNQAERISNTGRVIDQRRTVTDCIGRARTIGSAKWVYGTGTNGSSDISATIQGRTIKIEVKIGRDKQSEAQKQYQAMIEQAGGIYFIARSFQQFYNWYNEYP